MSQVAVIFRQKVLPNKWFQATCIAALVFVIYFYTSPRSTNFDQYVRLTDAFLHGRLYLVNAPPWLELARDGVKGFVINPPAPTLFLIPWVAIWGLSTNQVIVAMLVGAVAVGFFWVAATQLGWDFRFRVAMTVLMAFGTNFWWGATEGSIWMLAHVSAIFFLMAALVETTGKNRPWLIGILVGLAGLSRLPVFLTFPLFAYTVTKGSNRQWRTILSRLAMLGFGMAVMVALYLAYNYGRFGTISDMGYYDPKISAEPYFPKGHNDISYIPRQINAILFYVPIRIAKFPYFKPSFMGLGLFFTTPALLYMFRARLNERLALAALGGLLLTSIPTLTYAVEGWAQFGYRYSLDYLLFMLLLAASGMRYRLNYFAIAIIVLSCGINLWGTLMRI